MDVVDWYTVHNCQHAHCPLGCDKPQPFERDGNLYCSRCLVESGQLILMVPCTPEVCD